MARVRLTDDLVALIRGLHPDIKKGVRSALDLILKDPYTGRALKGKRSGLRSFLLGKTRIVYRVLEQRDIDVIALGPGRTIYQETYRRMRKSHGSTD